MNTSNEVLSGKFYSPQNNVHRSVEKGQKRGVLHRSRTKMQTYIPHAVTSGRVADVLLPPAGCIVKSSYEDLLPSAGCLVAASRVEANNPVDKSKWIRVNFNNMNAMK